ncbi:hypothetical protein ZYGR_0AF00480 [Zygosaccharomyces rouxii]|uniref:Nitrogen regulatory protein areA GATA-like domain-containing protein n=1 Tax=Zygosaccharomyces rouxii TaxID=4956 RepID=A0A1Q3A7D6_ZYGRO|nr:hypothetical protein ZYGR_0AF00480 [Zygosaccharomyces rouxii]
MADNLAAFFADRVSQSQTPPVKSNSAPTTPISDNSLDGSLKTLGKTNGNGQDDMGPSVSMAVHANDDDTFHKSTFNLKRTRSMGLLDEYIDPTKKLLGRNDNENRDFAHGSKSAPLNEPTIHARQVSEDEDEDQADDEGAEDNDIDDEDVDGNGYFDDGRRSSRRDRAESEHDDYNRSMSVSPPPADDASILLPQDDNDLMREPERHVDYLSHEWNESDISNSWKYIILKKKKKSSVDHVNAARLENASWRTWAKARNHLRTVSPEIVNWSKDSDVTWLYGPIVRESDNNDKDVEMGYGSDDETSKRMSAPRKKNKDSHAPKPILKKRTVQEILKDNSLWKLSEARKHKHEARHSTSAADTGGSLYDSHDAYDDYDALAAKVNAQYYGPKKTHSAVDADNNGHDESVGGSGDKPTHATITGSSEKVPQAEDPLASSVGGEGSNDKALKTILTSSNDDGTGSKSRPGRDRHIHFNDRVEQCMAIANPESDSDFIDNESGQSDDDADTFGSTSIMGGRGGETLAKAADFSRDDENSNTSSSDDGDGDDDDEDEDNAGLFISPAMPRRADSATHSPITDNSSMSSSRASKFSLNPIIKLLPATTLNHGSDDEASDDSDYDGYGSSVSHNVNTYRGYDYMYDYNSVYTGDTSSFLPVENCDVVDVPEGIGLHSAIAGDNASTYEFNHAALSDLDQEMQAEEQQHKFHEQPHTDPQQEQNAPSLLNNEFDNSGFESDEQFIEDSQYHSSDDEEEEDLGLKRAVSMGKSSSSGSLKDLSNPQPLNTITPQSRTCSFISGRPLNYAPSLPVNNSGFNDVNDNDDNGNHKNSDLTNNSGEDNSNFDNKNNVIISDGDNQRPKNPHFSLKRAPSSFIFNSESEEEEDDDESDEDNEHNIISCSPKGSNPPHHQKMGDSPKFSFQSHSKTAPPQSSVILPTSNKAATASGPQLSDLSKSIRIKNSLSPAEVGASDVAITGSFSPVNESIKSVVTNEGIIGKGASSLSSSSSFANHQNSHNDTDLRDVDRNLQDCHIDENGSNGAGEQRDSNESVHKMMQNAREIANKYLHSWRKGDGNSQGTKSDNKSPGTD